MKLNSQPISVILMILLVVSLISLGIYSNLITSTQSTVFLSTTTSVENTGLLDYLIEEYEKTAAYSIRYTAVGSGAAIQLARDGEVDATLTHAPDLEQHLLEDSYSNKRHVLWFNYFVIVGSEHDPAKIQDAGTAQQAFEQLYTAGEQGEAHFYSRGDSSGTHLKEQQVWNATGIEVYASDTWYFETGTGMSSTLVTTDNDPLGYTLSDIGTFATLQASESELDKIIVFDQDEQLYNPYTYMIINNDKTTGELNTQGAQDFLSFLQQDSTDELVKSYTKGGIVLFEPVENGD